MIITYADAERKRPQKKRSRIVLKQAVQEEGFLHGLFAIQKFIGRASQNLWELPGRDLRTVSKGVLGGGGGRRPHYRNLFIAIEIYFLQ